MLDEKGKLSLEEIGPLVLCEHCGVETYSRDNLPKGEKARPYARLPDGFTNGNARHHLTVLGNPIIVYENCRYDVFGAW